MDEQEGQYLSEKSSDSPVTSELSCRGDQSFAYLSRVVESCLRQSLTDSLTEFNLPTNSREKIKSQRGGNLELSNKTSLPEAFGSAECLIDAASNCLENPTEVIVT